MSIRHSTTRRAAAVAAVAVVPAALAFGLTSPAFAAGTPAPAPVNATVTILSSATLSLSGSTIPFGTVSAGQQNVPATAGIIVTATSNDPSGYSVGWSPVTPGEAFGPGFPVSGNMSLTGNGGSPMDAGVNETLFALPGQSTPGGDIDALAFSLNVPNAAPAGAMSAGFNITLTAV